jgi:polyphosphate kinase
MDGDFFIGSADWMYRNLSGRIEVVTPIWATTAKQKLWEILDICLRDRRQAWVLNSDEHFQQLHPEGSGDGPEATGSQQMLMRLARERISE